MPHITERELCDLIGEISAITLESEPCKGARELENLVVRIELTGHRKPIEIVRTLRTGSGEGVIGHAITRLGIRCEIERQRRK